MGVEREKKVECWLVWRSRRGIRYRDGGARPTHETLNTRRVLTECMNSAITKFLDMQYSITPCMYFLNLCFRTFLVGKIRQPTHAKDKLGYKFSSHPTPSFSPRYKKFHPSYSLCRLRFLRIFGGENGGETKLSLLDFAIQRVALIPYV